MNQRVRTIYSKLYIAFCILGSKSKRGRHSIFISQEIKPYKKRDEKKSKRKIDMPFTEIYDEHSDDNIEEEGE